jgi:uncharacterized protein (DUF1697 family)
LGVYVSFFRGINVGGRHLVKMDALRKLHENLGFEDVRTLLQSGNVVFRAKSASAKRIEDAFEKQFGFRSAVILRTAKELQAAADNCPFPPDGERNPSWIAFVLFAGPPVERTTKALEAYEGPERIECAEREIYIYYADGMGRSKLQFKSEGTVRNWNTVSKLLETAAALKD